MNNEVHHFKNAAPQRVVSDVSNVTFKPPSLNEMRGHLNNLIDLPGE